MARPKSTKKKTGRGGKRAGSGRKPGDFNKLRAEIVAAFNADNLEAVPKLLANMLKLANGGYKRVEEKYGPPVVADLLPAGSPPPPSELVLIERKVSVAEPDRAANIYLIDRVLGRVKQAVEVTGRDGGAIVHAHAVSPVRLDRLPTDDLQALERIAERLALGGPARGAEADPGGAVPA